MENSQDYESYIVSLDNLLPVMMTVSLVPPAFRGLVLGSSVFSATVRKGLMAIKHISAAARGSVAARANADTKSLFREDRTDLLQHLLKIVKDKGEAADFGKGEVEPEAYSAMYEHTILQLESDWCADNICVVSPAQTPQPSHCAPEGLDELVVRASSSQ